MVTVLKHGNVFLIKNMLSTLEILIYLIYHFEKSEVVSMSPQVTVALVLTFNRNL